MLLPLSLIMSHSSEEHGEDEELNEGKACSSARGENDSKLSWNNIYYIIFILETIFDSSLMFIQDG